ncbi:hypothetical protein Tco_0458721 [Tanacetum coccineum]
MRSKRTIKPTKIFDNFVTNTSRNMNKQKTKSKKNKNVNDDLNGTIEYEGESDLVNNNEIKDNGDIRVEAKFREDDMVRTNAGMVEEDDYSKAVKLASLHVRSYDLDLAKTKTIPGGIAILTALDYSVESKNQVLNGMNVNETVIENETVDENEKKSNNHDDEDVEVCSNSKKKDEVECDLSQNKSNRSFADATMKSIIDFDKKLVDIPTEIDENGNEIMVFDDVMIAEGTWNIKGISDLASRVGKPLVMDVVTASMCKIGARRVGFARVLVEISANKMLPTDIEVVYKNGANEEILDDVFNDDTGMASCMEEDGMVGLDGSKERRDLWKDLQIHKRIVGNNAWIMTRDMNVTLKSGEHSAGKSSMTSDMNEFKDCINNIEMEDVVSSGLFYTWTKNLFKAKTCNTTGVLKKLDKIIGSEEFIDKTFKFANFIADKKEFLPLVKKLWETEYDGCQMFKTVKKLKSLKKDLKKLTWKDGNIFDKVNSLKVQLKDVQTRIDKDPHDKELRLEESKFLNRYVEAMKDEEKLLFQKAKIKWLKDIRRFRILASQTLIFGYSRSVLDRKPFAHTSKLAYDESLGLIRFAQRDDEVVFRMPQRTKELDLVSPLEKDKFEAFFVEILKVIFDEEKLGSS